MDATCQSSTCASQRVLPANHKRNGAAHVRMHQRRTDGPSTQQIQTNSSAPVHHPPKQHPQTRHTSTKHKLDPIYDGCRGLERTIFASVCGNDQCGDDSERIDRDEELGRPKKLDL
jgi:hypothetical protein